MSKDCQSRIRTQLECKIESREIYIAVTYPGIYLITSWISKRGTFVFGAVTTSWSLDAKFDNPETAGLFVPRCCIVPELRLSAAAVEITNRAADGSQQQRETFSLCCPGSVLERTDNMQTKASWTDHKFGLNIYNLAAVKTSCVELTLIKTTHTQFGSMVLVPVLTFQLARMLAAIPSEILQILSAYEGIKHKGFSERKV